MCRKYFVTELRRMLASRSLWFSSVAVCFVLMLVNMIALNSCDIISQYHLDKYYTLFIAIFAFSSAAYANSLWEDDEHKYWQCAIIRGNIKKYASAKITMCFASGVSSVTIGHVLYFLIMMCQKPLWDRSDDTAWMLSEYSCFQGLMIHQKPFLYLVLCAVWLGMLGGIIALISMWLTLIARNRMFSICVPLAGYYFLINYIGRIGGELIFFDINELYFFAYKIFEHVFPSICYTIGLTAILFFLFGKLILWGVERRVRGGVA